MSRKDSKSLFAAVFDNLGTEAAAPLRTDAPASPHLRKVAAGVRELTERRELVDRMLREGEQILEIAPDAILPSVISDRLAGSYDEEAIAEIVESIRERGQISPGLVRPVRGQDGRYQIVFGRRRLAAVKALNIKFKAIVRELDDEQAVVLQGEENTVREDLSFIEKCAFALAMQRAHYKRATICAALTTSKSHISEMLKIAAAIPEPLVRAIGKAPGIGRGRWGEFADRLQKPGATERATQFAVSDRFRHFDSDGRFNKLHAALAEAVSTPRPVAVMPDWIAKEGSLRAAAEKRSKGFVLAISQDDAVAFGTWLYENLDRLNGDFRLTQSAPSTGD